METQKPTATVMAADHVEASPVVVEPGEKESDGKEEGAMSVGPYTVIATNRGMMRKICTEFVTCWKVDNSSISKGFETVTRERPEDVFHYDEPYDPIPGGAVSIGKIGRMLLALGLELDKSSPPETMAWYGRTAGGSLFVAIPKQRVSGARVNSDDPQLLSKLIEDGCTLLGTVHTHPGGSVVPSGTDIDGWTEPDGRAGIHFIVGRGGELGAYLSVLSDERTVWNWWPEASTLQGEGEFTVEECVTAHKRDELFEQPYKFKRVNWFDENERRGGSRGWNWGHNWFDKENDQERGSDWEKPDSDYQRARTSGSIVITDQTQGVLRADRTPAQSLPLMRGKTRFNPQMWIDLLTTGSTKATPSWKELRGLVQRANELGLKGVQI